MNDVELFWEELMQKNLPIWQQCLDSDFLQQMGKGTLSEDCLKGYMVDDSLYLREYAKVFALGMLKAKDMETIRNYYSLLSFVNEGEGATRLRYLQHFGLDDAQVQKLEQRKENREYTQTMLRAAEEGEGEAECMMACLPCMLSYSWIFKRLLKQYPQVKDTIYWQLVRDYASDEYEQACEEWIQFTKKVCQNLTPERRLRCKEIFFACSMHELHFWQMSEHPRNDI